MNYLIQDKGAVKITVSKAQKAATAKYEKENYDKILVRFPKGTKEKIKVKSDSVNGFIVDAVNKELEKQIDEFSTYFFIPIDITITLYNMHNKCYMIALYICALSQLENI